MGRAVDGVLVFDTNSVFPIAKHVQRMSVSLNVNHSALMSGIGKSYTVFYSCVYISLTASSNLWECHPQWRYTVLTWIVMHLTSCQC